MIQMKDLQAFSEKLDLRELHVILEKCGEAGRCLDI